jgi:hypothetical protein
MGYRQNIFLLRLGVPQAIMATSAYYGYPEHWILKCKQCIPRHAIAGIRTQNPLVESPTS